MKSHEGEFTLDEKYEEIKFVDKEINKFCEKVIEGFSYEFTEVSQALLPYDVSRITFSEN